MSAEFHRSPWNGHADEAELEQWLAVVDEVADGLAPRALERDRTNALVEGDLETLRASGLLNLVVPTASGGAGAHFETLFHVVRRVARADASVGQILGYHYFNQACITFYGADEARQLDWYRRSVDANWVWSDSFNPVSPDLSLVFDGEAYRLNGMKRFATGAAVADVVLAGAVAQGGPRAEEFLVFAVPTRREGVAHGGDWDALGYRASASGSIAYTAVAITDDDFLGTDTGEPFSAVVTPGVQLLFGNIYLGIAQAALAQARGLVNARPNAWFLASVDRYADDPVFQRVIGELVARTAAVEALADRLNRRFDAAVGLAGVTTAEDRAALELEIAALKIVATEVALDVTSRVYEATGASSTASKHGLDLHWRNVRTHSLHDPVEYKKIEVGAHYLTGAVQPVSLYT
jgi:alkylation response protein AidB-like acyl-CoA dehydrogenase